MMMMMMMHTLTSLLWLHSSTSPNSICVTPMATTAVVFDFGKAGPPSVLASQSKPATPAAAATAPGTATPTATKPAPGDSPGVQYRSPSWRDKGGTTPSARGAPSSQGSSGTPFSFADSLDVVASPRAAPSAVSPHKRSPAAWSPGTATPPRSAASKSLAPRRVWEDRGAGEASSARTPGQGGVVSPGVDDGGSAARKDYTANDDVGGLDGPLGLLREVVVLPCTQPHLYAQMRVDPPSGTSQPPTHTPHRAARSRVVGSHRDVSHRRAAARASGCRQDVDGASHP